MPRKVSDAPRLVVMLLASEKRAPMRSVVAKRLVRPGHRSREYPASSLDRDHHDGQRTVGSGDIDYVADVRSEERLAKCRVSRDSSRCRVAVTGEDDLVGRRRSALLAQRRAPADRNTPDSIHDLAMGEKILECLEPPRR